MVREYPEQEEGEIAEPTVHARPLGGSDHFELFGQRYGIQFAEAAAAPSPCCLRPRHSAHDAGVRGEELYQEEAAEGIIEEGSQDVDIEERDPHPRRPSFLDEGRGLELRPGAVHGYREHQKGREASHHCLPEFPEDRSFHLWRGEGIDDGPIFRAFLFEEIEISSRQVLAVEQLDFGHRKSGGMTGLSG